MLPFLLLLLAAPAPAPADLSEVAFIAGRWVDEADGALSEETWTEPSGDGMLGMWRLVIGGKAKVLELLAITREPAGPALRLRHFDRNLVAREEKDTPLVLPLVRHAPGEAVFEGPAVPASAGTVRLSYRRDGDALHVTLEKQGKKDEFSFRRAPR